MRSWPLATAAVLAVLSFGILQLTPPDEVTPGMVAENNVLSPVTRQVEPASTAAKQESLPAAAPPSVPPAAPGTMAAASAPASPSASDAQLDSPTGAAKGRVAGSTSAPAGPEKKVLRESAPDRDAQRDRDAARTRPAQAPASAPTPPSSSATAPGKEELANDKQSRVDALATLEAREHTELAAARSRFAAKDDKALATAPASSAGAPAAAPPSAPAAPAPPAMAAAPRPDPFPAAGSANTTTIEAEPRRPAQAGAVSPTPQERTKLAAAADSASPATDSASTPAASSTGAAKPQANVDTRRAEPMQAAPPSPLAKSVVPTDAVKDAPVKPPEEWIKLIRKLKSEGRNDDAARELAAFRAAYKERADALLPADLRAASR
jgi:hypothetical protein